MRWFTWPARSASRPGACFRLLGLGAGDRPRNRHLGMPVSVRCDNPQLEIGIPCSTPSPKCCQNGSLLIPAAVLHTFTTRPIRHFRQPRPSHCHPRRDPLSPFRIGLRHRWRAIQTCCTNAQNGSPIDQKEARKTLSLDCLPLAASFPDVEIPLA